MNEVVELSTAVRKAQIALTIIGLSGIILSFVPFSYGNVPLPDVLLDWAFSDPLWLLAAPCIILPVPISVGYIWWLITGRFPFSARQASYVLSGWLVVSCLVALIGDRPHDTDSILLVSLFGAAFIGAMWLSIRGIPHDSMVRGLVLMQSVYIAPMAFLVVGFGIAGDFEFGAGLGAVTLLTYLAQIAFAAKRFIWVAAVVIPVACIAVLIVTDMMPL
jgi:hypothetical protein